jgi:hypothetical protein
MKSLLTLALLAGACFGQSAGGFGAEGAWAVDVVGDYKILSSVIHTAESQFALEDHVKLVLIIAPRDGVLPCSTVTGFRVVVNLLRELGNRLPGAGFSLTASADRQVCQSTPVMIEIPFPPDAEIQRFYFSTRHDDQPEVVNH